MCGCVERRDGFAPHGQSASRFEILARVAENLDRDGAVEPRVAGTINLAHAAFPEERHDLVGTEAGSG